MGPWVESVLVIVLALAGAVGGWWFSRRPGRWWLAGFVLPSLIVLGITAARRFPVLEFVAPISWLMAGRTEYALIGPAATMLLGTPLCRLKEKRQRVLLGIFLAIFVIDSAVMPFLMPVLIRPMLADLTTSFSSDGVCLQTTAYTCGPAAAVTALRQLGFPAQEGELAILAHTSPSAGTAPDWLADALHRRYGSQGLVCQYRIFRSIDELPRNTPTLAVTKFGLMVDHFVAILQVTDREVIVGDPLEGRVTLSRDAFAQKWRNAGVVLRRRE